MKNKGFSLVELIIVIAIMAILAAAIAPALIRYIDKSRRSDDVAAGETINTAAQGALSNEDAYDEIQALMPTAANTSVCLTTASADTAFPAVTGASNGGSTFVEEINSSCGGKSPKLKFKKKGAVGWSVGVNDAGKPVVWIASGSSNTAWMVQPEICPSYK